MTDQDKQKDVPNAGLGTVYLVGAGPGDPRLITLWGIQCLQKADVVIYDYLVNPALLEYAPKHARRIPLGHHSQGRVLSQEEINDLILVAARNAQTVVRLKGGDPLIFGRFAEEASFLRRQGIPTVIIPGITAALAAASLAEIPLTHADQASAVAFVAGNEHSYKGESHLDYQALARFPGTLIYYMGVRSAAEWTRQLIAYGKSAATPVVLVRRCGWPDQKVYKTTLGDLPQLIANAQIKPPAVIIVGETAREAPTEAWYVRQPLFGQCVLVTRAEEQATELRELLESLGAHVVIHPVIEILPVSDWRPLDEAISSLDSYQWIVFTSGNGVRFFMERLFHLGADARRLRGVQLAVIGPGTAATLRQFGLRADLVPGQFCAEKLAEELNRLPTRGRILLVRASRGRPVLLDELRKGGWDVNQVTAYESRDVTTISPEVERLLTEGRIHWVTATSPSIATAVVRLFGNYLPRVRIASISPITSAVLREHGFEPAAEAQTYTIPGVVDAIVEVVRRERDAQRRNIENSS